MPVFFPGNVQEVLDLGLHALACSRASGPVGRLQDRHERGRRRRHRRRSRPTASCRSCPTVEWDGRPYEHVPERQPARARVAGAGAHAARRRAPSSRSPTRARTASTAIERRARDAWLGIVAAGKAYYDLLQALRDLGLDERELERAGIRLLKLGMLWPLEPRDRRASSRSGLDEILVVEEKGPFLETHAQGGALRHAPARRGSSASATSTASRCCRAELRPRRRPDRAAPSPRGSRRAACDSTRSRRALARARRDRRAARPTLPMARAHAVLLLGLPAQHARPQAPDGTLVGAGIGCHTMVLLNPEGKGEITGITQMGGEGAQWIGMAPFTDDRAPRPEPRRRHLPPLRLAGDPRRGRRRREHHLQAALQRAPSR